MVESDPVAVVLSLPAEPAREMPLLAESTPAYHEHDAYAAREHEHDAYARHETVAALEARLARLESAALEAPAEVAEQPENAVEGVEAGLTNDAPAEDLEVVWPEITRHRLEKKKKRRAF
jgi:hypothetical protein